MDKIYIRINSKTGMVYLENTIIGRDMENLQQELIFSFEKEFVSGSARLEYKTGNEKYHIPMTRNGESYTVPIKNVLTKEGRVEMQLVVVQIAQDEEIPVFKSNVFYMYCNKSINAQEEAPDDYEYWLDVIEEKLAEVDEALDELDNVDIDASKIGNTATVSITNKEGITKSVEIYDGQTGAVGPQGPKGDKGEKGDTGEQGPKGDDGETGPSNTLTIGSVTKGENASATITGTSPNQILNLVLPKGDKGDKGNTGATGNDGYSPSASVTQLSGGATITITDKTGTTTATITSGEQGPTGPAGKDGKDGKDGADAKINGVNALNIAAGTNISLDQQGSTLTINSTGGSGGTSDYEELDNLPSINNIELKGNKTSSDLGLITNAVDDLVNYYKKSETFTKQEVNNLISAITTMDIQVVQTLPTEDISTTTIYLVPKTTAETNDAYDEYIYVSNAWEHIGSTEVDLTNYITNTDYAGSNKSGVIRTNPDYGTSITSVGALISATKTYQQYQDTTTPNMFISKGTLENVITGKGLVSNTDYATSQKGGVLKVSDGDYGMTVDSGVLKGTVRTLAQYNDMSSKGIVCKGTLENVLADRIGDVDTVLTRLTIGGGVS